VIFTSEDVAESKPEPEIYLKACKAVLSRPQSTVVFEDSNQGMISAIRACCKAIMIPDLSPPSRFVKSKAFKIYPSLTKALENNREWFN